MNFSILQRVTDARTPGLCALVYLVLFAGMGQSLLLCQTSRADDKTTAVDPADDYTTSEDSTADSGDADGEDSSQPLYDKSDDDLSDEDEAESDSESNSVDKPARPIEYVTTDYVERQPEGSIQNGDVESEFRSKTRSTASNRPATNSSSGGKTGINGQFGHIGFKSFGRQESITHVELLPYATDETHMWFSDLRLFVSNTQELGGNAGVGYRYYHEGLDQVFGASFWYDADNTTQELFKQVGLSLESYGDYCEIRANFYLPVGDDDGGLNQFVLNPQFVNNNLQYDIQRDYHESLKGVDAELGFLLPSNFSKEHNLKLFGGFYHFAADNANDIDGYKVRLQGNVNNSITTQVELTDDATFGTNVTIGAAILFPDGSNKRKKRSSKSGKLREFVRRNYNVIVADYTEMTNDVLAINAATGTAYTFGHVDTSAAPGGTGTVDDPFDTVANAQAAGQDIIFVHSGSTINTAIVLQDNEILLGEGAAHYLDIPEFGSLLFPSATGGTVLPTIQGVAGDAVTLASGVEFSGFTISGSTGDAIVGSGITDATLQHISILNAGGQGIFLDGVAGIFSFTDVSIQDTTGTAFHVDGGTADVNFGGTIDNTSGRSIVVENTTSGTVNLSDVNTTDTSGEGILISANAGNVVIGDFTSTNSTTTGVDIQGGSGNVTFSGTTVVNQATAAGINVQNTTGTVTFADVDVTSDAQTALFVRDADDLIISGGTLNGTNGGAAADIADSAINIQLASIFADGGPFGVSIVDSTGQFAVFGSGSAGSGGLIQNTTTGVLLDNFESFGMQFVNFDSNNTGIMATDTNYVELSGIQVTDSVADGVALTNVKTFSLTNSVFTGNGGNSVSATFDVLDTYTYTLNQNTFTDATTSAVVIDNTGASAGSTLALQFNQNVVTTSAANASGLEVNWDGIILGNLTLNQFIATNDANTGININNASTTGMTQVGIWTNEFNMMGTNGTGIQLTTAGPSDLSVGGNGIALNGAGGTGMSFNLAQNANVHIYSNLIVDNVASGTGILFDSISGPANVAINDNTILLLSPGALADQGIVFNSIPAGIVSLFGTLNNTVIGATTAFSSPAGTTTGQIIVNGTGVQ